MSRESSALVGAMFAQLMTFITSAVEGAALRGDRLGSLDLDRGDRDGRGRVYTPKRGRGGKVDFAGESIPYERDWSQCQGWKEIRTFDSGRDSPNENCRAQEGLGQG